MRLLFSLSFVFPCLVCAGEVSFTHLVLNTGKTYQNAVITSTEPDSITVRHTSGIARVPYETLPAEVQEWFEFDPTEAMVARQAFIQEIQEQSAVKLARAIAVAEERRDEERAAEKLENSAPKTFIVFAVTDDGLLVNDYTPGYHTTRRAAGQVPHGNPETGEIQPVRGDKVYLLREYEGEVVADDDVLRVLCYLTEETYQYVSIDQKLSTVRVYDTTKILKKASW